MGCDIHLVVEVRNENGEWERALPPPEARDPWLVEQAAKLDTGSRYKDREKYVWFDDRNYNLFAILADVRNGFDFVPISEPRGLPDDLSPEVQKIADGMDDEESNDVSLGDHSQSWLTLKELLDYDWGRGTTEGGWVDVKNFLVWQREGCPRSWSQSVGGGQVEHLSWRDMKRYIEADYIKFSGDGESYTSVFDAIAGPRRYFAYVEWPIDGTQVSERFHKVFIPALQKLGKSEDVRIVFGFDS